MLGVQIPLGWKGSGTIQSHTGHLGKHHGMQLAQKMHLCHQGELTARPCMGPMAQVQSHCHWGHWHCHLPNQDLVMSFNILMPESSLGDDSGIKWRIDAVLSPDPFAVRLQHLFNQPNLTTSLQHSPNLRIESLTYFLILHFSKSLFFSTFFPM